MSDLRRWAITVSLTSLLQIPLDFVCYPDPCGFHAIPWIAATIVVWASFAGKAWFAQALPALPHEWPAIVATTAFIFASHADAGVSAAISGASNRSITGLHLMRVVSIVQVVPFVSQWLHHTRHLSVTRFFSVIALTPLTLLEPLLLAIPGTWEARNVRMFEAVFVVEALVLTAAGFLSRVASYYSVQWQQSSEQNLVDLDIQATLAQNLLETAVPPFIARSLLAGTPPDALARSFDSATIAFILLEDYSDKMSIDPCDAMSWLDRVFVAFDSVVDRYDERVNKIEVVANTYLLSTGLPVEDPNHVDVMCAFCADIQALCHDLPGVGPVKVRIGVASGPVTSGVIGHSRRFFRVFGDTVNMASRMMSTGLEGHIHVSESVGHLMQASQSSSDASIRRMMVIHRGKTAVKGKGDVDTYWLVAPTDDAVRTRGSAPDSANQPHPTSPAHVVASFTSVLSTDSRVDVADAAQHNFSNRTLSIRVPRKASSVDDVSASAFDVVHKIGTPGLTLGGTPGMPMSTPGASELRVNVGNAHILQRPAECKRTTSDIFLRRTVGERFMTEIRRNPCYSRNETDVTSPSVRLAVASQPWLHTNRAGSVTIHRLGPLVSSPKPDISTPVESPVETICVSRDSTALDASIPAGTRGLVQTGALDVILESSATNGDADTMIPGTLASERSAPFSSQQSIEIPFQSAALMQSIAEGINAGCINTDTVSLSETPANTPGTSSGFETSIPPARRQRDGVQLDIMVSGPPTSVDCASVCDIATPAASIAEQDDSKSQVSCQERRVSTKSHHKLYETHHTAASNDSRGLSTSPTFKPLSIRDRVAGTSGNDGRPRHLASRSTPRSAEHAKARRSSFRSRFEAEAGVPGTTTVDAGAIVKDPTRTSPSPHILLKPPPVADVSVQLPLAPPFPHAAPVIHTRLPSTTRDLGTTKFGVEPQSQSHLAYAYACCSSFIVRMTVVFWDAFTVPRFVDEALEDSAKQLVHLKMVDASFSIFAVAAITVAAITIALTLLGEFNNPVQYFVSAVVVAVLAAFSWHLRRVKSKSEQCALKNTSCALLLTIFFAVAYMSLAASLISHRDCEVACVFSEQMSSVDELTWAAFILSVADLCTLVARIDAAHSRPRIIFTVCTDIVWLTLQSHVNHTVDPAAAVVVFFALFAIHLLSLFISIHVERLERSGLALKCALEAAVTDRKRLLDDLFPPIIVEALVAGSDVPPLVSTGTVVLHIDFVGFTRMCSELTPQQIMRTMNAVYSVFDELVEGASAVDGALWKVDTVGDAYMVVGGIARIGSQREFRSPSNRGVATPRLPGTATIKARIYDTRRIKSGERRTRELLERIFSLARTMQDALIGLRDELGVPLRARMGVHCGDVVSGILGSQRPRFCVLGPAMLEAERIEASGIADEIACSKAVQDVYLSTAFQFERVFQADSAPGPILLRSPRSLVAGDRDHA